MTRTATDQPSWWRRHAGVRLTTSLSAAGVVALALAVAGLLLVFLLGRSLRAGVEQVARDRAQELAGTIERDGLEPLAVLGGTTDRSFAQVLAGSTVVLSSPEIAGEQPFTRLRPAPGQVQEQSLRALPAKDADDLHHVVAVGVRAPDGRQLVVAVAQALEPVTASMQALTTLLLAGVPVLVLLVGGSTFILTGRALRPVEAIRRRVSAIDASQLGQRVPVPPARDEVGRLAETMNDMLARLEAAATAQRRFVSDASHELRSPLATVRTTIEVAQAYPEVSDWREVGDIVLAETHRLQTLVADLLLLARSDERGLQLHRTEVDLDDLCEQETQRIRRASLSVTTDIHAVRVLGDVDRLARVLRNLVDNAMGHARAEVGLRLWQHGGTAILEVRDDGPGVPASDRTRVFDRFVRLDESRVRSAGGTGLGLPIVRQIVRAHGGQVFFLASEGAGATVRVVLPLGT